MARIVQCDRCKRATERWATLRIELPSAWKKDFVWVQYFPLDDVHGNEFDICHDCIGAVALHVRGEDNDGLPPKGDSK